MTDPRAVLTALFHAALAAADPLKTVPPRLPPPPKGRTVVVGAGKAAAAMAEAVEKNWTGSLSGVVVTQYGHGLPLTGIEVIEAAHPVPDDNGARAARRMLDAVSNLTPDDMVLCLLSGGGSALMSLPAPGIDVEEKRALHKALVRSGAPIHEINCVRKHLSAVKGGRLARAAYPARVSTLIISDVPGDDPATVASGPTLPDAGTSAAALAILEKYNIPFSNAVRAWLQNPASETPKPGDVLFAENKVDIVSSARDALDAARRVAADMGLRVVNLGDEVEGEARDVGASHARAALADTGPRPVVFLSGGETTVTVTGQGRGGRNSEYILAAAMAADGSPLHGIACGTDGLDGSGGSAGAVFMPDTLSRARAAGLDPAAILKDNDTHRLFHATGDTVITGPTRTNVNDFRALLLP